MLPDTLISDTSKRNKEQFLYHKYKFRCHHKTKHLFISEIHHKCCQKHSFQIKQKQRKLKKHTENQRNFQMPQKKTNRLFDHKIHNKCCQKHSFQSKQKNKEKRCKNKEKPKNTKIQKM